MLAYTNLASPVNPPNAVVEIVGVLLPPRVNAALIPHPSEWDEYEGAVLCEERR